MKFGLMYTFQSPLRWPKPMTQIYGEVFEQIAFAEGLGYDSVWVTEHHFVEDGYGPSVLPVCAAMAAKTSRMRIGTAVLILPLHNAIRLAEDAAVVDIISGGRLILGVGMGYKESDFTGFGLSMKTRKSRMEEGLEVLKLAWTEDSFSYSGKYYNLPAVSVTPKPVQKPYPPLWIAGASKPAIYRAAKHGCLFYGDAPLSLLHIQNRIFRRVLEESGKAVEGLDVPLMRGVYVAEDNERAWDDVREYVMYLFQHDYRRWGSLVAMDPEAPRGFRQVTEEDDPIFQGDRLREDRLIIGDPAHCIEEIRRYREAISVNHLILRTQFPGLDQKKVLKSIELFAKEVMPHFREDN